MDLEDLGLVGNCQFSALIACTGDVVWCCLPRFDSEPVFGKLLDPAGGDFAVEPMEGQRGRQRYLENTNVLETAFDTPSGRFRIVDFAPRFIHLRRTFRPTQLIRIVEPLEGRPVIRIRCEPRCGWSKRAPTPSRGSNHLQFPGFESPLRLTSDVAPTYLGGQPFALTERRHLVLSWGEPVEDELPAVCGRFLEETVRYWQQWVKHCNIPPHFQREVIRAALTLKLHCFEDTGAIIAATTTSIPEAPGSGRTWDYRYCWLRDAYYVLDALRLLGHFEERESFIQYLLNIAAGTPDLDLRPIYRVDGSTDLEEQVLSHWAGFNGDGPVRIGNAAVQHQQHDVFGELVLALAPVYMDERFVAEQSPATMDLLLRLARKAVSVAGTPDAGIWEYRKAWVPQTFSTLMCWAAADRAGRVLGRHSPAQAAEFQQAAERLRAMILTDAWNEQLGGFAATHGGAELDAALLQFAPLRFLSAADPKLRATVRNIGEGLLENGWLFRYRGDDGLGVPTVAFVICSFWYIEALAFTGAVAEARRMMKAACRALTPLGLIAEDLDTRSGRLWGNFPQAYSHVGLIHAAFACSPDWHEVL